jgi:hypothetical protein
MTRAFQRVGAAIADDPVVQQKLNAWQVASIEMTLPREDRKAHRLASGCDGGSHRLDAQDVEGAAQL